MFLYETFRKLIKSYKLLKQIFKIKTLFQKQMNFLKP